MFNKILTAFVFVLMSFSLVACSSNKEATHSDNMMTKDSMMKKDIVDVAVENGSFNTLVAAVKAAGLVDTLKSDGPFTVFAPTDEAFAKLPAGTVETLLKPENKDQLIDILTYHVVSGKVMASDVVKLNSATTVEGKDVAIEVKGSNVMINNATVIAADVPASNGVIHVIDSVLLPK
ncbi:fasciclin domain-containing protein [Vibrio amylolyticus]